MGAGASMPENPPFSSIEEALKAGKTQEEVDAYLAAQKDAAAAPPAEGAPKA